MLKGVQKRKFHTDVKKLKEKAESNNWDLMTLKDATSDSSCVLSDNETDIGFEPDLCDKDAESYFLAGKDLMEFLEII